MYTKSLVAFIDILGFKEIIETGSYEDVNTIYNEFGKLGNAMNDTFNQHLSAVEYFRAKDSRESARFVVERARTMFFSDCVIWTYPIEGFEDDEVSYFQLISGLIMGCSVMSSVLMKKGILIRGGVALGNIHIVGSKVFGPALVEAYLLENKAKYPQIVLSKEIVEKYSGPGKRTVTEEVTKAKAGEFYAIDEFKFLQRMIKFDKEHDKFKNAPARIQAIIDIIPKGIKHKSDGVREKYNWLRLNLAQLKDSPIDLNILQTSPFSPPARSLKERIVATWSRLFRYISNG